MGLSKAKLGIADLQNIVVVYLNFKSQKCYAKMSDASNDIHVYRWMQVKLMGVWPVCPQQVVSVAASSV